MIIKNVKLEEFRSEERTGYNRDGEFYRSRTVKVSWPDEDGKRTNQAMAMLRTQPCEEFENRGLSVCSVFDADVYFYLSQGRPGYYFNNTYINKIL